MCFLAEFMHAFSTLRCVIEKLTITFKKTEKPTYSFQESNAIQKTHAIGSLHTQMNLQICHLHMRFLRAYLG